MTVKVLATRAENDNARAELRRHKLSCLGNRLARKLREMGVLPGINIGFHMKSWDVLNTVRFIRQHVPPKLPVLDIGAHGSEILYVLRRMNYTSLTGIDLNQGLMSMPHTDTIRCAVADFMHTPFADGTFGAITAISAIEHGFRSQPLLSEISRLLRPGGYFLASFDYWPDKIDTSEVRIFGMDWTIFSREEVLALIRNAKSYNLIVEGEVNLEAKEKVIGFFERNYTFAWLVLQKK